MAKEMMMMMMMMKMTKNANCRPVASPPVKISLAYIQQHWKQKKKE